MNHECIEQCEIMQIHYFEIAISILPGKSTIVFSLFILQTNLEVL